MKSFLRLFAVVTVPLTAVCAFGVVLQARGERIPVKAQFQNKVIYDISAQTNPQPLVSDCDKRGGTFFAAACPDCNPRCEFGDDERLVQPGWQTLSDADVGVSFHYPETMLMHKNRANEVSLTMYGPTQAQSGDLNDGIRLSVRREPFPPVLTFEEYAEQRILDAAASGQKVLSASPVLVGRLSGESFRTFSDRESIHLLFPAGSHEAIAVEYTVIDPKRQQFDHVVESIISSLRLTQRFASL